MWNEHQYDNGCLQESKKYLDKSDIIFFDVGANIGDFTNLFQAYYGNNIKEIHCFEPNKNVYENLCNRNKDRKNIFINNHGLSSKEETTRLEYPGNLTVLGSVFKRPVFVERGLGEIKSIEIELSTLDKYVEKKQIENIDYLKIDTEGNEMNVLLGAERCFKDRKIICGQIEYGACYIDAGTTLKDVYWFLNKYGYFLYDVEKRFFFTEKEIENEDFELRNYFFTRTQKADTY